MTYPQRKALRLKADRDRRVAERQAKAEQQADAVANPPAAPETFQQRQERRKSEDYGRQVAADKAAAAAKAAAGPSNPFRVRANECADRLHAPGMRSRFDHFNRLADAEDARRAAAAEAAAKQAAIDSDPSVILVRQYADGQIKLTRDTDLAAEAAEAKGMADAGDAQGAWAKMKAIDEKLFAQADKRAAEARQSKAVTDSTFSELATAAEQARERAEQSTAMVEAQ